MRYKDPADRGQRPDSIIDMLRQHHSVDIQWGNHDILWMGAMCGNEACIATVVRNCLSYNNTAVLEKGYAISLRSLSSLASKLYPNKTLLIAMQRTISIILFKLEGQLIKRNPDFQMDSRLLLDKIDYSSKHIKINNMFTQKCFIRKNTPELVKRLEELGYKASFSARNEIGRAHV